ncbi:leucyl aminopeptidase [Shewanella glacialipiscicola]|uniref:Probable cytosol aminopeptidase n=1 Tax=Shewanella glacialipiscicola TaxID=614069 RepID=A0ABQ6IYH8_9GAMM|nr:leucyl aminopeptidase [Shewanella glacialipiscicola]MCL1086162.1 leucyl aminopeptidase [Shewanella glacialipiscicola]GIU12874.1 putative cytosol aminopeptidase 1 [Shewanella glacialipiscicola]GMA80936.1 putative cytosol aminopeptidase 1 [Shewanella glacialipiscicola]
MKNKHKFMLSVMALACLNPLNANAEIFSFDTRSSLNSDTLVLFQSADSTTYGIDLLPQSTQDQLNLATADNIFSGKQGETLEILVPSEIDAKRILLVGIGDAKILTPGSINTIGGNIAAKLDTVPQATVRIFTQGLTAAPLFAAELAHGIELRSYRYTQFKASTHKQKNYQIAVDDLSANQKRHKNLQAVEEGVFLARDLTNAPAGIMYPDSFANEARKLKSLGVKVTVLEAKDIERLQLGALAAVGKGSERPPKLVVAHWPGSKDAPIALVGKGITFDSGGYNIKATGTSIARMKSDMAGAATVLGTIKAMAIQKAAVNVVAIMPMAENMISGHAMIPGDVIKTAQGLTVEVLNTDAEGRLVLADGLWYAREHYNPSIIIDVATLTGSKVGALGSVYAGLFTDSETLVKELTYAGQQVDEKVWRLPLDQAYADELKSTIADLKNTGKEGSAGASSAAMFLKRFAGEQPWAHLDIAGNALTATDTAVVPAGATGYGVRLLSTWLTQPKTQ